MFFLLKQFSLKYILRFNICKLKLFEKYLFGWCFIGAGSDFHGKRRGRKGTEQDHQ